MYTLMVVYRSSSGHEVENDLRSCPTLMKLHAEQDREEDLCYRIYKLKDRAPTKLPSEFSLFAEQDGRITMESERFES